MAVWQRRRRRGGGAGGTNLLFFRDGKLDICAPVSVFTATAGKYAAHFMDTWRCEIGTGRGLPSTGELLKLVPKKGADKVYNQCRSRRVRKVQISTLFEWRIEGYWLQWTLLQSCLGLTFTVVQKFCTSYNSLLALWGAFYATMRNFWSSKYFFRFTFSPLPRCHNSHSKLEVLIAQNWFCAIGCYCTKQDLCNEASLCWKPNKYICALGIQFWFWQRRLYLLREAFVLIGV